MKKLIFCISICSIYLSCTYIKSMEKRRPRPSLPALQREQYQPTHNMAQIERFQEALLLLKQHYSHALQEGEYLPNYFFTELDNYYQQVPHTMPKIRSLFSGLKQTAEKLREPELTPTQSLSGSEEFSYESL